MVYEFLIVFIGVVNVRPVLPPPPPLTETLSVTPRAPSIHVNRRHIITWMTFNNILCIT